MLLGSCARNISETNPYCIIYEPIYTSKLDTELTRQQVDRANAAFDCLCDDKADTCKGAGF